MNVQIGPENQAAVKDLCTLIEAGARSVRTLMCSLDEMKEAIDRSSAIVGAVGFNGDDLRAGRESRVGMAPSQREQMLTAAKQLHAQFGAELGALIGRAQRLIQTVAVPEGPHTNGVHV